jgi:hypothetical protein
LVGDCEFTNGDFVEVDLAVGAASVAVFDLPGMAFESFATGYIIDAVLWAG